MPMGGVFGMFSPEDSAFLLRTGRYPSLRDSAPTPSAVAIQRGSRGRDGESLLFSTVNSNHVTLSLRGLFSEVVLQTPRVTPLFV